MEMNGRNPTSSLCFLFPTNYRGSPCLKLPAMMLRTIPPTPHTHTHTQALLVPVIMTLVDPLTQVMYFCAVCQLPKCVFWLQSGSCIVGNVDEKWQAIITCHSCPLLSPCLTADRGMLLKTHIENHSRYFKNETPAKSSWVLWRPIFQEFYGI